MIPLFTVVVCFENAEEAFREIDVYEPVSICYCNGSAFISPSLSGSQEYLKQLQELHPGYVYKLLTLVPTFPEE